MKSLLAQFTICQTLMPCTVSSLTKTCGGITSAVLIRICCSLTLTFGKTSQYNMSRKSESVSFCLHDSQRRLSYHLYLDFLYPLTASTTDLMYWTDKEKVTFHLHVHAVLLPSLLNRQVKFCQDKYHFIYLLVYTVFTCARLLPNKYFKEPRRAKEERS